MVAESNDATMPSYHIGMEATMSSDRKPHPYVRIWVSDIVQSCQDMSTAQFGAHVRMLLHAWDRGYCPSDMTRLMRIVGDIGKPALEEVLERWVLTEAEGVAGKVYMNRRLEQERQVMIDKATARSAAAQKANAIRWASQTDPIRIANGSQTDPILDARCQMPDASTPESRDETPIAVSSAPRKARAKPRDTIGWSIENGWSGITDRDRADWSVAYPLVNIDQDLAKAHQHLLANPAKQAKRLWRKFLTNWFNRTQEGGGSRAAGNAPARRGPPTGHIPADAHPDDHYLWYMANGWTPRQIPIYRTADGRERWLNGDYTDEETSPGDSDANDE
jgi:uncharacterized protein YdaU (DUF1376 family)